MRSPSGTIRRWRIACPRLLAALVAAVPCVAAWPREVAAQAPPPLAEYALAGCGHVSWPGYAVPICTTGVLRLDAVAPGDPFTAAVAATVVLPSVGPYPGAADGILTPDGALALRGLRTGARAPILVGGTESSGEVFALVGCCVDPRSYRPIALTVRQTVVARNGYYDGYSMWVPELVAYVSVNLAATSVGAASTVPEPTPRTLLAGAAGLAALAGLAARLRVRRGTGRRSAMRARAAAADTHAAAWPTLARSPHRVGVSSALRKASTCRAQSAGAVGI